MCGVHDESSQVHAIIDLAIAEYQNSVNRSIRERISNNLPAGSPSSSRFSRAGFKIEGFESYRFRRVSSSDKKCGLQGIAAG
jgi:hypothetical protein